MRSPRRRPSFDTLIVLLAALVGLTACGSSADDGSGTTTGGDAADAQLQTVKIGVVPTLSLGVLAVGQEQGHLADEGLDLDINPVDSGPNVITGLVAGQYDLGFTAYAPPLVALAGGQPLRLVSNVDDHGEDGENGGVFVRTDSPITRWKDLEGARLGTNAPRSMAVLWVQGAIAGDGGDPSTLELVPLPFNQIAENVSNGRLDAGITLQPYQSQGLKQFDNLKDLGDPAATFLPAGTPAGGIFTTEQTAQDKAELIARFEAAYARSVEYANGHLDEVRASGAELTGLSSEDAATIPLTEFKLEVDQDSFKPLLDAMVTYGWAGAEPDIQTFLGSTS